MQSWSREECEVSLVQVEIKAKLWSYEGPDEILFKVKNHLMTSSHHNWMKEEAAVRTLGGFLSNHDDAITEYEEDYAAREATRAWHDKDQELVDAQVSPEDRMEQLATMAEEIAAQAVVEDTNMTVMTRDAIELIRSEQEDVKETLAELGYITEIAMGDGERMTTLSLPSNKRQRVEQLKEATTTLANPPKGVHFNNALIKNMGHALVRAKKINQNMLVEAGHQERKFQLMKKQCEGTQKLLEDCQMDMYKSVRLASASSS